MQEGKLPALTEDDMVQLQLTVTERWTENTWVPLTDLLPRADWEELPPAKHNVSAELKVVGQVTG